MDVALHQPSLNLRHTIPSMLRAEGLRSVESMSRPLSLRFCCPPEIIVLEIQ